MIDDKVITVEDEHGRKEYQLFWDGWTNIINSLTEEEYERNLKSFWEEWPSKQKNSVTYVLRNWSSKYKEMFVLASSNNCKYYDNVFTSIVESARQRLKLYFDFAAGSFI